VHGETKNARGEEPMQIPQGSLVLLCASPQKTLRLIVVYRLHDALGVV
jgi:hypothetical protein